MKRWKPHYRRYLGFTAVVSGFGLMLEHYISYGGTLHFTGIDHGVVGLILIVAGALAAGLKPGQKVKR